MAAQERTAPDPRVVTRARDLLDRAEALSRLADDAPVPADQLRELYVSALRGAGAALAVGESSRGPRRGSASAWARLPRALPPMATWATYFAGLSRLRADIEAGIIHDVDAQQVRQTRARVQEFLDDVEAEVLAYEQSRPSPGTHARTPARSA